MITAFNSVYASLQGFLSRSFWFATFLPVALFCALHAAIAHGVVGPIPWLSGLFEKGGSELATAWTIVIVALVVMSYALLPFMARFRGLLDGSQLPAWLHDWIRKRRLADARATIAELTAARNEVSALEGLKQELRDGGRLRRAYRGAEKLTQAVDRVTVDQAKERVGRLRNALTASRRLREAVQNALDAVVRALESNNPNLVLLEALRAGSDLPPSEKKISEETNAIADELADLIDHAAREALYRLQILQARHRVVSALRSPRATSIGDARLAVERYANDVYKVDFEFLWPRMLAAMKAENKDDTMLEAIETARTKVDFAVLSLVLMTTVPMAWLPAILFHGEPAWLFFVIGVATPLVLRFFYELVYEGQLALGDVVKTAIDRSRFLVLRMLHQPEPLSRSEERALWARIAAAEGDGRTADLVYVRKAP